MEGDESLHVVDNYYYLFTRHFMILKRISDHFDFKLWFIFFIVCVCKISVDTPGKKLQQLSGFQLP